MDIFVMDSFSCIFSNNLVTRRVRGSIWYWTIVVDSIMFKDLRFKDFVYDFLSYERLVVCCM